MLMGIVYQGFRYGSFNEILTTYLLAIALVIALASATFSYARVSEAPQKEFLKVNGGMLLYAAITMIITLLISGLLYGIKTQFPDSQITGLVVMFLAIMANMFLFYAGNAIMVALTNVEDFLHKQTLSSMDGKMW